VAEIKLDMKKSTYTLNEYEDLLGRISEHVKSQGLDLMHIFEIFCKKSGFISYADLRKIIDLIDFPITEKQFELLCMYADEEGQQNVHAYDLA
jgi:Ca2+-binding EF-hand superfamily protein